MRLDHLLSKERVLSLLFNFEGPIKEVGGQRSEVRDRRLILLTKVS